MRSISVLIVSVIYATRMGPVFNDDVKQMKVFSLKIEYLQQPCNRKHVRITTAEAKIKTLATKYKEANDSLEFPGNKCVNYIMNLKIQKLLCKNLS